VCGPRRCSLGAVAPGTFRVSALGCRADTWSLQRAGRPFADTGVSGRTQRLQILIGRGEFELYGRQQPWRPLIGSRGECAAGNSCPRLPRIWRHNNSRLAAPLQSTELARDRRPCELEKPVEAKRRRRQSTRAGASLRPVRAGDVAPAPADGRAPARCRIPVSVTTRAWLVLAVVVLAGVILMFGARVVAPAR